METGDGLLARMVPVAPIGIDAFAALCAAAQTYGNGLMEVSEIAEIGCPADLSGDGLVGAADLVVFLGQFGCMANCGGPDLDGDGLVGVSDLVILLGEIGSFCE